MKGSVFNAFEAFVDSRPQGPSFEVVLDGAVLESAGPHVGPATYPDADLVALVVRYAGLCRQQVPAVLVEFGRFLFGMLHSHAPGFARAFDEPVAFLESLDRVIHVEVRKLDSEAYVPTVLVERKRDGGVMVSYHSKRQLCALAEGLLLGVADHYDHDLELTHPVCMHDGHERCLFYGRFTRRVPEVRR